MPSCLRENTAETRGGVRGRLPTKDGGDARAEWRCPSSVTADAVPPSPDGKALCKPSRPAEGGEAATPSVGCADSSLGEGANGDARADGAAPHPTARRAHSHEGKAICKPSRPAEGGRGCDSLSRLRRQLPRGGSLWGRTRRVALPLIRPHGGHLPPEGEAI